MAANIARLIDQYVMALKEAGAIRSATVEAAFRRVPRHQLIERIYQGRVDDIVEIDPSNPAHLAMIYSNRAFTTRWWPAPSSTTLPALMALLLELLELRPGMRAYQMEFSPLSESSEHKPVFGADAWAINRNCFRQLVRL